jgi:hypothetical protein
MANPSYSYVADEAPCCRAAGYFSTTLQQLLFELLVHLVDLLDHTLLLHRFPSVDSGGTALVGCNPDALDPLLL